MTSVGGREIVLVGASHKTAGLAVREIAGVSKEKMESTLVAWRALPGVEEVFILSTCNRTEVVAVGADAAEVERTLRIAAFPLLPADSVYACHNAEAVFHVFSVCAGLRSMVLGESEVQAQFKEASLRARASGALGPHLEALLQQALRTGKRVRTETAIGLGTLSLASAAVELAERVSDDFPKLGALIVGAGDTGTLVAKHLRARGLGRLTFANRTHARAAEAAEAFGAEAATLDELPRLVAAHELIVACVEAPEPLLDAARCGAVEWPAADAPKVFVDLSVPRALAPDLNGFRDAFLFDLDAIEGVVGRHRESRKAERGQADRIIVDETAKFFAFRTYAALSPALAELRGRFDATRAEWLAHAGGDPALDLASKDLVKRLLAVALARAKGATRLTQDSARLELTYRRYVERVD